MLNKFSLTLICLDYSLQTVCWAKFLGTLQLLELILVYFFLQIELINTH